MTADDCWEAAGILESHGSGRERRCSVGGGRWEERWCWSATLAEVRGRSLSLVGHCRRYFEVAVVVIVFLEARYGFGQMVSHAVESSVM